MSKLEKKQVRVPPLPAIWQADVREPELTKIVLTMAAASFI